MAKAPIRDIKDMSESNAMPEAKALPEVYKTGLARRPGWLRSPQRVWLRRAIFQVHLWLGVALSCYAVVIGLTGSALVFREEIERVEWPDLHGIRPQLKHVTLDESVRNIEASRAGWKAFAIRDFNEPTMATTILMRNINAAATPNYRQVAINPYTGDILQDRLRYAGLLGWMGNLHVYLMAGQRGLLVSGFMALGLLILCISGLILWWPGIARWTTALLLNPRARWKRLNWEIHSVVGFWSCAALLVVTFTGLDFAFPDQIGWVVELVVAGRLGSDDVELTHASKTAYGTAEAAPIMTIDQAVAAANRALPIAAPGGYLSLPASANAPYKVTGYYVRTLPYSELVRVTLDSHTGAILSYGDTREDSRGGRVEQYFTTVHFGSFGGEGLTGRLVKALWFLLGLVPAMLAATGLLMFWNRQLRPSWLKRQRARA